MSVPPRDPFREDGAMGLYAMLQNVDQDVKKHALLLTELSRDIRDTARILEKLDHILRGDDGQKSLMMRIELVEGAQNRTAGAVDSVRSDVSAVRQLLETTRTEDTKGRWSMASSVVTGMLALIAAILTALLTTLMRRGAP